MNVSFELDGAALSLWEAVKADMKHKETGQPATDEDASELAASFFKKWLREVAPL